MVGMVGMVVMVGMAEMVDGDAGASSKVIMMMVM